jgi:two-component system chemotaxis response regulator CheY
MKHCLIVDDSDVIRRVARHFLEQMNFIISEASSGEDALESCRARMPDAILVDWHMPSMSGSDLTVAVRLEKDGKKPRIVYCTSEHDVDDIARALNNGADDYLIKPFDRESFEAKFADLALR